MMISKSFPQCMSYIIGDEYSEKQSIAIEKVELVLIDMLKEWLKNTNIASYNAINKQNIYRYFD